jgi:outer membrane receptor protein involved in Fe transport
MKKKLAMFLSLFFIGIGFLAAQTQVRGTVVDENGESVFGASVLIQGTTQGTVTDANGVFTLSAPSDGTLVISYVGYVTQEVPVSPRVNVTLLVDRRLLDDVIVVAYGTAKKESFTGSASVIDNKKLELRPITNISKGLEGQSTGIITTSGSGQPGSSASLVIRGFGSINASQAPLYVVDGIPFDGSLSSINPSDIETMTILKDASAGAL